jgi:hypothetical protein
MSSCKRKARSSAGLRKKKRGLHSRLGYPIVIPGLAVTPLQVTLTVPVPGFVAVPIFQNHETCPLLSVPSGFSPGLNFS